MTFRIPQPIPEGDVRKYFIEDNFEYSQTFLTRTRRILFLRGIIASCPSQGGGFIPNKFCDVPALCDDIVAMNAIDEESPIYLIVDSPGGDVGVGMILYDHIRMSKAPIVTVGHSAASMAATILAAGRERIVLPHARCMLHLPTGSVSGDPEEVQIRAEVLRQIMEEMVDAYVESGVTAGVKGKGKRAPSKAQIKKQIYEDIDKEHWLTAPKAVEYGLADRVAKPSDIFATVPQEEAV